LIVGEHDAGADKRLILDRHAFADEAVRGDLAARADRDAGLHLDERPDPRLVSYRTTIEIDEVRLKNLHVASERDIVGNWHKRLSLRTKRLFAISDGARGAPRRRGGRLVPIPCPPASSTPAKDAPARQAPRFRPSALPPG